MTPYLIGDIIRGKDRYDENFYTDNRVFSPLNNYKGKSGGGRICFVDFVFAETVYLITAYGKNEKANLSKAERSEVKKMVEALKKSLGGESNE